MILTLVAVTDRSCYQEVRISLCRPQS